MQLNDKDDKLQNIYLHFDKKANAKLPKAIPVPRYYWKVVYDPVSKTGTAFIGVNYPKKAAVSLDEKVTVFCNDVWKEIVFVQDIQRQNTKAGYSTFIVFANFGKDSVLKFLLISSLSDTCSPVPWMNF